MKKKLKIVMTPWHVMHYSDLANALKDHADFYMIDNTWREWRKDAFLGTRPIPDNVHFVPYYEKGKYDLAILSVDQQLVNMNIGKRKIYMQLKETIGDDIPVITINHGTPVYPEYCQLAGMTEQDAEDACKKGIKKIVGDSYMVCNSKTARDDWGWGDFVRHGMNPEEWYDLPKEPRAFTALSPGGCDRYYNRDCMHEVSKIMDEAGYTLFWAKINTKTDNNPEAYKQFLGRSLVYIDTSYRTPLNRARSEAMLSGSCVIQVEGEGYHKAHDLDYFGRDGDNMFIVENSPKKIAELALDLIENRYDEAIQIGQTAKKTIQSKFSYDIYRDKWLSIINKVLNK